MSEYNYSQDIEAIKNPELKNLVRNAIYEKLDTTPYIMANGKTESMHRNLLVHANLKAYIKKLIAWAIDPNLTRGGNDGYGFALLLTHVLRYIFSDEPGVEVFQSSARLDFDRVGGTSGNTADIVIGKREGKFFRSQFLVESKLGYKEDREHGYSNLLRLPVILLQGDEIFGNSRDALRKFAANPNPSDFAAKLARTYGGNLKTYIKQS